jgi:chemotaxis protein CheX
MNADLSVVVPDRQQEWLPILELAVHEVFEIMLGSRLAAAEKSEPPAPIEFTAIVGLSGSIRGTLTFCCGSAPASQIAARMVGEDAPVAEEQVWDAIGEICNMIAGNFKNKLTGLDGLCLLSVPAVITGRGYRFHSRAGGDSLEIVLLFESAPLVIRLDLHA